MITCTPSGIATVSEGLLDGSVVVSSFTSSVDSSLAAGAESPLIMEVISSHSSPMTASNTSTGEVSPSCIPMCNRVPS